MGSSCSLQNNKKNHFFANRKCLNIQETEHLELSFLSQYELVIQYTQVSGAFCDLINLAPVCWFPRLCLGSDCTSEKEKKKRGLMQLHMWHIYRLVETWTYAKNCYCIKLPVNYLFIDNLCKTLWH